MSTPDSDVTSCNVVVRRLGLEDADLFRRVRLAALQDAPDAFAETLEEARQSDWSARTANGAVLADRGVFVAVSGDLAVGMVFVKSAEPPIDAFLGGMWVDPAVRRQGIGRALIAHGLDFLRSNGQSQVALWVTEGNAKVLGFYRGLGFRETGRTSNLRANSPLQIVELGLDLT